MANETKTRTTPAEEFNSTLVKAAEKLLEDSGCFVADASFSWKARNLTAVSSSMGVRITYKEGSKDE